MNDLKSEIRRFVVDSFLFGQDPGLADDASFLSEGIVDSTGVLELVAYLEKAHGVHVRDEELTPDNLDSVAALAAYIQRKKLAPPAAS